MKSKGTNPYWPFYCVWMAHQRGFRKSSTRSQHAESDAEVKSLEILNPEAEIMENHPTMKKILNPIIWPHVGRFNKFPLVGPFKEIYTVKT